MAQLKVRSIVKSFSGSPVLRDVSFRAEDGEIVCLLGPSGCGKTTALRIVAGLETADAGDVLFDGAPLSEVPVHRRGFGLMFQDFALFPHKDVAANVAFGLRMQRLPAARAQVRVAEMLDLVGLAGYERRQVYELSGGEQQRVALARSLAPGPRLLMLDEPLGSLDRTLRESLMNELRAILKRVGVTVLYVTHDQQEAFAVADRVLIMNRGQIVQHGTPQEVYARPATAWVARFLGLDNLLPGRLAGLDKAGRADGPAGGQAVVVDTAIGKLPVSADGGAVPPAGREVTVLVRPEAAQLAAECAAADAIPVEATVKERSFRGGHWRLVVGDVGLPEARERAGVDLVFDVVTVGGHLPAAGERVRLALRPEGISLLRGE